VAYLTLVERKVLAALQRRVGPDKVGPLGLLQPIADAIKLIAKETVFPRSVNLILFLGAPAATFALSLCGWAVIAFGPAQVCLDINLGLIYIFAVSSLGVYGVITARLGE